MHYFFTYLFLHWLPLSPSPIHEIVVAADGSGQFTTIQAAINSLPESSASERVIRIKNGLYREKVYLEKHHIALKGQSQTGVQIVISEARDIWRCDHPDDWGAAAINLHATDILLENLTVINEYGFITPRDTTIVCGGKNKEVRRDGHQFALRAFPTTTRLTVKNCTFRALGGDTVSPWNVQDGLYYFEGCTMEGGVDLFCPRGWSWAENCRFICHNRNAAIWHDGTGNQSAKNVLKNCTFEGDADFALGRYHRDAQFFLIDCRFSPAMANRPIYKVRDTTLQWPHRAYFYRCQKEGSHYPWLSNNISDSLSNIISPEWVFESRWRVARE